MKQKYYGVRRGRQTGVFDSWPECQRQIVKYSGAEYKSFSTPEEAQAYAFPESSTTFEGTDDANTIVDVWVDGSCMPRPNGLLLLGWAYLARRAGEEIHRDRGNDIPEDAQRHRNVAGEIMAVLKAVEWCKTQHITSIRVYYDYQGLASWPTHAWKRNTPFTQHYAETIRASGISVEWVKVKAHSGDPNNDIVDEEAKKAALEAAGSMDGMNEQLRKKE
ncbi:ribonuclease H1 domain-containing protein [Candidatus Nitrospira salsa]